MADILCCHVSAFKDQMGNTIELPAPPERIVSVVPSQTELLSDLGLDKEVAGITRFCVHPGHWRSTKPIVGGTKNINFDVVDELKPDLIIANKEENTQADILRLRQKYRVWLSDVSTADGAYEMIASVGGLTARTSQAGTLIREIKAGFAALPSFEKRSALYLIWKKPWMSAGTDTFIHDMMRSSGFKNVISEHRYPELSDGIIRALNPEVVLLSSEPFPFKPHHAEEIKLLLPKAEVRIVDGEMFSWYGSRMRKAPEYFKKLRGDV